MSLINREDTINYLMTNMNWHDEDGYTVEDAEEKRAIITDLINGVPDADDGWISVEKRLPEIDMSYPHSDYYFVWYDGCDIPDIASYSNVNRFWTEHITDPYWNAAPFCKVTAWRPLPPAFKPKEDK